MNLSLRQKQTHRHRLTDTDSQTHTHRHRLTDTHSQTHTHRHTLTDTHSQTDSQTQRAGLWLPSGPRKGGLEVQDSQTIVAQLVKNPPAMQETWV